MKNLSTRTLITLSVIIMLTALGLILYVQNTHGATTAELELQYKSDVIRLELAQKKLTKSTCDLAQAKSQKALEAHDYTEVKRLTDVLSTCDFKKPTVK